MDSLDGQDGAKESVNNSASEKEWEGQRRAAHTKHGAKHAEDGEIDHQPMEPTSFVREFVVFEILQSLFLHSVIKSVSSK